MQLKQRIKRLAALLLAMSMALGCMPGSAWAETATPTDLIATSGEALPDTTLPSATPEPEGESGVPGTENSETTDSPGNEITETDGKMDSGNPLPIQTAILEQGHVYAATVRQTYVYSNPAMTEDDLLYTPMAEIVWVLATEFVEPDSVKIWFLNDAGEVVCGYVQAGDLDTHVLLDEEIAQIQDIPTGEGMTDIGMKTLFIVSGAQPAEDAESEPAETQEDTVSDAQQPVTETPNDDAELQPEQDEPCDAAKPLPDSGMAELLPPDENADELALAAPGEYVSVTTDTRVFDGIDAHAVEVEKQPEPEVKPEPVAIKAGDKVVFKSGVTQWGTGSGNKGIPSWAQGGKTTFTVLEIVKDGTEARIGNASGAYTGTAYLKDLEKVG